MSDFPTSQLPLFVHTYTPWGVAGATGAVSNITSIAAITWTANQAVYMPVTLPWAYPVTRVFWVNGSTIGNNVDFGIYSPGGQRIYSTGSTAQVGTSTIQYVSPATPFILPAGRYFFAYVTSGTTSTAYGNLPTAALAAISGMLTQATALPLPASATFATFSNVGIVLAGITRTPAGSAF
jgi:hypothetical protein